MEILISLNNNMQIITPIGLTITPSLPNELVQLLNTYNKKIDSHSHRKRTNRSWNSPDVPLWDMWQYKDKKE